MFGGIDTVLVLGNNNFTDVFFDSVEMVAFGGAVTATFDQLFAENPLTIIGDGSANRLAFTVKKGEGELDIDLSDLAFQSWAAADRVFLTGTGSHNVLAGSNQADVINGRGGSDFLQGNGGRDSSVFDTGLGRGVAHVVDFGRADDIKLDNAVFTKLKAGALAKAAFTTGDEANDTSDRIIFDADTGMLRYDKDGSGGKQAHVIAILDDVAGLKAADFFVI